MGMLMRVLLCLPIVNLLLFALLRPDSVALSEPARWGFFIACLVATVMWAYGTRPAPRGDGEDEL